MFIIEIFKTALGALTKNKVRSFLTMLGVIIGVFAVTSLVSMVRGIENYVKDQFAAMGSNIVMIMPGKTNFAGDPSLQFANNKLDERHVEMLERDLGSDIYGVTPIYGISGRLKYRTESRVVTVYGANELVDGVYEIDMSKGRMFNKAEVNSKSKVAVISPKVEEEVFGQMDSLGETIKIRDKSFEVIGVFEETGPDFDNSVFIPDSVVRSDFGIDKYTGIVLKVADGVNVDETIKKAEISLLKDLDSDEFTAMSQEDMLKTIQDILGILTIVLAAIAGISLFVGGIGIMNIMLVSVTERISEIGLRKALGATSRVIGSQFFAESVIISTIGGIIGLGLGYLATFAVRGFFRAEIPWWAVLTSLGFSLGVGAIFGTYPALMASKKDPIEALRYE